MAIILPASFQSEIERPQQSNPMLWLLELTVDPGDVGLPPVILRICDGQEQLQWPLNDPDTTTWYPFPFSFSPIEQTQEGDLVSVDLTVDNSARTLARWLHAAGGLEGNRANLYLVPSNSLAIEHPDHEFQLFELEVAAASMTDEAVTFRLSMPNFFQLSSPTERYIPSRCRWQFGSQQCGYVINGFAAFTSCPKLFVPCVERGEDLKARGLPPVLPGNFGGHPGITRQR